MRRAEAGAYEDAAKYLILTLSNGDLFDSCHKQRSGWVAEKNRTHNKESVIPSTDF